MFGLPIVTAAWWAAQLAGAKRWVNSSSFAAIAAAAVVLAVLLAITYGLHTIRADAAATIDAAWRTKQAQSDTVRAVRQAVTNRRADEAAERERQIVYEQLAAAVDRAAALERELARLQAVTGGDGDPIVFPQSLARELRK